MRVPGDLTFLCLVMFFVVSIDPKDPVAWHNAIKGLAGLCCGTMALITKIRNVSGKKHLISGRSGNILDVI